MREVGEAVVVLGVLLPLDAGVGGHSVLHVRHGDRRRPRLLLLLGVLDEQEVQDFGLEVKVEVGLRRGRYPGVVADGTVAVVMVVEEPLYAIERGDLGGQKCLHVGVRPVTEME